MVFVRVMRNIYHALMRIGRLTGCHQMPERSFHVRGYQFPLCARCTGIVIGELAAIPLWFLLPVGFITACILGVPLVMDGGLQYFYFIPSTNLRRVVTGFLAGWGLMTIYIRIFVLIMDFILR